MFSHTFLLNFGPKNETSRMVLKFGMCTIVDSRTAVVAKVFKSVKIYGFILA